MVSNIYTVIMVVKNRQELGVGNQKLLERRRSCTGIPKLVILIVLAFFFFLIMSCFIPIKEIFLSLHDTFSSCKNGWFSKQIVFIVSPKMQIL
jgi:hypothetical protein